MTRQFLIKFARGVRPLLPSWALRQLVPYSALIATARIPTRSITGEGTGLFRPEAVTFTPSGDLMAISNSASYSVTMYKREDEVGAVYDTTPCCTISDPECLNYVHDVVFSPCGKMLVVAARDDHSISIFVRSQKRPDVFEAKPSWTMRGAESELAFPTAIALHPTGGWLAVANRKNGTGITLYRSYPSGERGFNSTPFQNITEEELATRGLAAPHGLDFSKDGNFLFVVHKRFFQTERPQGESAIAVFQSKAKPDIGLDSIPACTVPYGLGRLHSIACHPFGEFIATTNEATGIEMFQWQPKAKSINRINAISLFRLARGVKGNKKVKGVAFTSDGEQIAVTTKDQVLFFAKWGQRTSNAAVRRTHGTGAEKERC